ncbi:unnamed protein product [Urochloa decumbens]|uniref:DUF1618 domain-containing protein n=1 Tax=Urochloa decumbens TaxID=240449 RepID=A0ABC9CR89_9POAL
MSAAAAATFPSWAMLEPFVFRRDDDSSFPDATTAPIRASGTTSWGATFTIAFSLANPPLISRIYAHLPGFPDRFKCTPLAIMATHRHLALLRVGHEMPSTKLLVQDFFVYNAGAAAAAGEEENRHLAPPRSSLKALPPCTEPKFDYNYTRNRNDHCLPRRRPPPAPEAEKHRRLLTILSMGLLCRGDEEFVVAELNLYCPSRRSKVCADICWLRSSSSVVADSSTSPAGDQLQLGGAWNSMRVEIQCSDDKPGDVWRPCGGWQTNAVIPFRQWLEPSPSVFFLRLPLDDDDFPACPNIRRGTSSYLYRAVSVVGHGRELKFVKVARHDGVRFGTLKPGTGFTITCHTLLMSDGGAGIAGGGMAWEEEYKVTSDELWDANLPEHLPRDILMYPQVDIERPHVVHFLFIGQWKYVKKKMWVVSIDMSTKIVQSCSLYINGMEGLQTDDAELIEHKSMDLRPFLPCEFPKFLQLSSSRKRKDME